MADINTSALALPAEVSNEIWAKTIEDSAVMQLARRIELPGNGVQVPIITGDPEAAWVAETDLKPVSNSTFTKKTITPYKLAVIETVSKEFMDDLPRLYQTLLDRLPKALGAKFDQTVFGTAAGAPGSDFDVLGAAETVDISTDAWAGLVEADAKVAAGGYMINGWAIAPQGKSILLGAVDGAKRPLFVNSVAEGAIPQILGNPATVRKAVYRAGEPATVGFAGDWTTAVYGTVNGIELSVSDQATLTVGEGETINLWQQNMVGLRAEIRVGFRVQDIDAFVQLTGTSAEG